MLCLSGFELYSRWVPLLTYKLCRALFSGGYTLPSVHCNSLARPNGLTPNHTMAYCSLRNEMERNENLKMEMKICSLRNENLPTVCEMAICSLRNENL